VETTALGRSNAYSSSTRITAVRGGLEPIAELRARPSALDEVRTLTTLATVIRARTHKGDPVAPPRASSRKLDQLTRDSMIWKYTARLFPAGAGHGDESPVDGEPRFGGVMRDW